MSAPGGGISSYKEDGSFTLLNRTANLGAPIDWLAEDESYLWRFNLHYLGCLNSLDNDQVYSLLDDWIKNNPIGLEPAWHPYALSMRLINWTRNAIDESKFVESLFAQSEYLYHSIEYHIGGNHILENARALMHAAVYFAGDKRAEKWRKKSTAIYLRELADQILSDGGHFERSPMYHAIVLEGILDVIYLLDEPEGDTHRELSGFAERMMDFLISVTHPDGMIALFNDATQEIGMPTSALLDYGRRVTGSEANVRSNFPETGYFVHRDDVVFVCIDGGPVGPDHLPAHAHADIFSYELSLYGHQVVVDTGVYEYEAGAMRDYVRGTAAHNTLQVNDIDQVECWASFRVARRYRPDSIIFKNDDFGFDFSGRYEGYGDLIGDDLTHFRKITYSNEDKAILIEDLVTGGGNHRMTSRIHLHPDVEIRRIDSGLSLTLTNNNVVRFETESAFDVVDSVYCPEFGTRVANKTIVLFDTLQNRTALQYRFLL